MAQYWGSADGRGNQMMVDITWSQNIAKNQTTVTATYYLVVAQWVSSSSFSIGNTMDGSAQTAFNGGTTYGSGTHQVMRRSYTVTHNSAGARSITVTGYVYDNMNAYINVAVTVSNLTLPTIARATMPNFSGTITAGSAKTINLPRASSSFTHDVTYKFGTASGTIATGAGVTASWTPPLSLLALIPNATSGNGTISVVTKSGGTTIGTKTIGFTLYAPASAVPSVSAVSWEDTNPKTSALGAFLQGLSTIRGTVTAAGYQGSTIKSRRTKIAGTTVTAGTAVRVTGSGTVTASGEATDSRGRVGSRSANFTVLPYEPPTMTAFEAYRIDANGNRSDTGTRIRAAWDMAVSSILVGGVEKNRRTITIKTRTGGGAWVTRSNGTYTTLSVTGGNLIVGGGSIYLTTESYDVRVEVSDEAGQVYAAETTVGTSAVTLDLNGSNVGVGKFWERGKLDVGGVIYAEDLMLSGGPGRTLWNGTPIYLQGTQTASLTDLVSNQLTGIVLAWSRWAGNAAYNDSWNFSFVPKSHVANQPGTGIYMPMSQGSGTNTMASKYVYVHDDRITGNVINSTAPESGFVLRYVYGV